MKNNFGNLLSIHHYRSKFFQFLRSSHRCIHFSRIHTYHRDIFLFHFLSQNISIHFQSRFTCSVCTRSRSAFGRLNRSNIDNYPLIICYHLWQRQPGTSHRTYEISLNSIFNMFQTLLIRIFPIPYSTIIDEAINMRNLTKYLLQSFFITNIADEISYAFLS